MKSSRERELERLRKMDDTALLREFRKHSRTLKDYVEYSAKAPPISEVKYGMLLLDEMHDRDLYYDDIDDI